MNMHIATPTERLLYAAHQERLRKFWPVKPQAESVKETIAPALPNAWLRLAWDYLEPGSIPADSRFSIGAIKAEICDYFGITHEQLIGQRRTANLVRPRQIGYFICNRRSLHSLPVIGSHFGERDHTTILYGVRSVERKLPSDPELASDIAAIERRLA